MKLKNTLAALGICATAALAACSDSTPAAPAVPVDVRGPAFNTDIEPQDTTPGMLRDGGETCFFDPITETCRGGLVGSGGRVPCDCPS
jgi:hypothetical protein